MVSLYSSALRSGGLTAGRADRDLCVQNVFAAAGISIAEATAGVCCA